MNSTTTKIVIKTLKDSKTIKDNAIATGECYFQYSDRKKGLQTRTMNYVAYGQAGETLINKGINAKYEATGELSNEVPEGALNPILTLNIERATFLGSHQVKSKPAAKSTNEIAA